MTRTLTKDSFFSKDTAILPILSFDEKCLKACAISDESKTRRGSTGLIFPSRYRLKTSRNRLSWSVIILWLEQEEWLSPLPNRTQCAVVEVAELAHIERSEGNVTAEVLHIQLSSIDQISFANFDKPTESSTSPPAVVKKVTS